MYITGLLRLDYVLKNVYPGDFSSCSQPCTACASLHTQGRPQEQWQDEDFARDKRNNTSYRKLVSYMYSNGFPGPIEIELEQHAYLINGHHRVYAALDLGIVWLPARIENRSGLEIPLTKWRAEEKQLIKEIQI